MLLEFSLFFNNIFNMFLNKVQQSYCCTQLCNYREEFVFKPISNQLNILVSSNLSLTRSLNASFPWNGWIILSRLNIITESATSFSSLILHAVKLLLWKKIVSLTAFDIIALSRPNTLLRVFLMGSGDHNLSPPRKNWVPLSLPWSHTTHRK